MSDIELYGYGIYGIYCDDVLVYVGMTMKSFGERFQGYIKDLQDMEKFNSKKRLVIEFIANNKDSHDIEMRPIINVPQLILKDAQLINRRDVELMELALIAEHKPVLNLQGVKYNYPLEKTRSVIGCEWVKFDEKNVDNVSKLF